MSRNAVLDTVNPRQIGHGTFHDQARGRFPCRSLCASCHHHRVHRARARILPVTRNYVGS